MAKDVTSDLFNNLFQELHEIVTLKLPENY